MRKYLFGFLLGAAGTFVVLEKARRRSLPEDIEVLSFAAKYDSRGELAQLRASRNEDPNIYGWAEITLPLSEIERTNDLWRAAEGFFGSRPSHWKLAEDTLFNNPIPHRRLHP